jgi:hypothetical protein
MDIYSCSYLFRHKDNQLIFGTASIYGGDKVKD